MSEVSLEQIKNSLSLDFEPVFIKISQEEDSETLANLAHSLKPQCGWVYAAGDGYFPFLTPLETGSEARILQAEWMLGENSSVAINHSGQGNLIMTTIEEVADNDPEAREALYQELTYKMIDTRDEVSKTKISSIKYRRYWCMDEGTIKPVAARFTGFVKGENNDQ